MSRTIYLTVILLFAVALNWIGTVFIYDRLPAKLPFGFGSERPYDRVGTKTDIFYFPGFLSFIAVLILASFPLRRAFYFPGKKRLRSLPEEAKAHIYDRIYQVVLVIGIFIVLIFSYIQTSIILYALDVILEMKTWPVLAALVMMVFYVGFNLFLTNKAIRFFETHHNS